MSNNQPKPYQVHTQYLYNGKWRTAGDHVGCDTVQDARNKGAELVVEQRKTLNGGVVTFTESKIPRRYVIRQLLEISEPM